MHSGSTRESEPSAFTEPMLVVAVGLPPRSVRTKVIDAPSDDHVGDVSKTHRPCWQPLGASVTATTWPSATFAIQIGPYGPASPGIRLRPASEKAIWLP